MGGNPAPPGGQRGGGGTPLASPRATPLPAAPPSATGHRTPSPRAPAPRGRRGPLGAGGGGASGGVEDARPRRRGEWRGRRGPSSSEKAGEPAEGHHRLVAPQPDQPAVVLEDALGVGAVGLAVDLGMVRVFTLDPGGVAAGEARVRPRSTASGCAHCRARWRWRRPGSRRTTPPAAISSSWWRRVSRSRNCRADRSGMFVIPISSPW